MEQLPQQLPLLPNAQILPILPPPPIDLFDLTPPQINNGSYTLYIEKKHLAMINGEKEFGSSKQEVQVKCKKQFQQSQKNTTETQSTGEKQLRNLQICTKCERCGHWIENVELKSHKSFHAAYIVDGLFLGDKLCSSSRKQLIQRTKVTHVVNAASQLTNHFESQGIKYLKLELYDNMVQDVIELSIKAAQFINSAIESGGVVFVHCAMGKSRSVSSIIMYLMLYRKMNYEESLKLIRINRPMAKPNPSYERQLKEYYEGKIKGKDE